MKANTHKNDNKTVKRPKTSTPNDFFTYLYKLDL